MYVDNAKGFKSILLRCKITCVNRNNLMNTCVVFIPASSYSISHEILIQITRYVSVTLCHRCVST